MFERALSAADAAFVSAIIVNPLDVAKVGSPGHSLPHSRRPLLPESVCVRPLRRLTRFLCLDADEVAGPGGRGAVPPACPDGGARPECGEESDSFCSALRAV